jgi:hypothetical protein
VAPNLKFKIERLRKNKNLGENVDAAPEMHQNFNPKKGAAFT